MASVPPPEIVAQVGPALSDFVARVNAVAGRVQLDRLNSWYRSIPQNYREGGDPCSAHLFALAADVQHADGLGSAVAAAAARVGLVAVPISATASHLQYYPGGTLRSLGVCPTLA